MSGLFGTALMWGSAFYFGVTWFRAHYYYKGEDRRYQENHEFITHLEFYSSVDVKKHEGHSFPLFFTSGPSSGESVPAGSFSVTLKDGSFMTLKPSSRVNPVAFAPRRQDLYFDCRVEDGNLVYDDVAPSVGEFQRVRSDDPKEEGNIAFGYATAAVLFSVGFLLNNSCA
jgi:hypothetical protein